MSTPHTPRSLRTRLGITQEQLAKLAGVSVQSVAAAEAGSDGLRLATLEALAHALDVEPAELVEAITERRKQENAA